MCYAQKTHIIEPAELEITYSVKNNRTGILISSVVVGM